MAAYVNKFYPEFVIELTTRHGDKVSEKRSTLIRVVSYIGRLLKTFLTLRIFYLLSLVLYLTGYVIGTVTLKESDV